ncbi:MAG: hypothetical protein JW820_17890, partial [Spirochaetales bacterium]|nr:hypothetical protein [Spirochaetales bacterium]
MSLPLPSPLLHEGREVLAVPLGTLRKDHVLRLFPPVTSEPGYRVVGQRVEPWHFEGFFARGNTLFLYGPGERGRLLETVIGAEQTPAGQGERPAALPWLVRLAEALARLEEHDIRPRSLQTDAVLFLDQGGVLFLPPGLMKKVLELHPAPYKLQVFEPINHPDWLPRETRQVASSVGEGTPHRSAHPSANLSFALGALAYRGVLGEYPFAADSAEEMHNRVRHLPLASPAVRLPGLRGEPARFILRALGRETGPPPSLGEWAGALADWNREGLFRALEPREQRELAERARAESARAARAYGRKVFWQRKGLTVGITAAVLIVVGILLGSYVRHLLAPRATLGFTPRQVVEAYLQAMNSLDHDLMEDCTADGAGRETIREVINLYVMSRVTQGYEGVSSVLPADEWDRMGRPPLEPPKTVFGITDLELREIRGEPEPVFEASYTRWFPVPVEEPIPGQGGDDAALASDPLASDP